MAKTLTKKMRGFANDYADTGNGVRSALKNYDTTDYLTANQIAVENLQKPIIQEELKKLGFDSNNAKRVTGNILHSEKAENRDRIKAAENVFKVHGDYAPEKSASVNVNVEVSAENTNALKMAQEYEAKLRAQLHVSN